MRSYSLTLRLLLGLWALLVLVLAVPFLYFSQVLEKDLEQDAYRTAANSLGSLEWALSQMQFNSLAELDAWSMAYGPVAGQRVSYIVGDRLAADSEIAFADLEETEAHSARPEVLQARNEGLGVHVRYSNTVNQTFIYAAKPTDKIPGIPAGVIRLAIPASSLTERLSALHWSLAGIFILSLLVGGLLCLAVTRWLMRNIREMAETAQEIGNGNYSARLYDVAGRELRPLAQAINGMARNIEEHLAVLADRNHRLEALFAALQEGVLVCDLQGHILSANPAAARMFPGLEKKPDGSGTLTLMEATMLPPLQDALEELQLTCPSGESPAKNLRLETQDGLNLEAALLPFGDKNNRNILLVLRDISAREQVERLRRDFVANVSHELKTPLTSIKGYTEALLDMQPSPGDDSGREQQGAFLRIIARNAEHMHKIVQSLLLLAQAEHHGAEDSLQAVDIMPLLTEAVQDKTPLARSRGLHFSLNGPEQAKVRGLPDGLREIFHNILGNAVKYADAGSDIAIGVTACPTDTIISCKNQGPVIPPEQQARIFERFYRLDRDGNSEKTGSAGLGLAICKRTIAGYGGGIRVESPAQGDRGAIFFVTLRTAPE